MFNFSDIGTIPDISLYYTKDSDGKPCDTYFVIKFNPTLPTLQQSEILDNLTQSGIRNDTLFCRIPENLDFIAILERIATTLEAQGYTVSRSYTTVGKPSKVPIPSFVLA